ncbi:MAG: hypothetical protein JNK35_13760 [Phycisphaerae bacterium]|nr:hypothetical protein [Phycisphaerae bacterium]
MNLTSWMGPLGGAARGPIGLELGSRWVKAVQLRGRPGRWAITAAARFERPAGARALPDAEEAERLASVLDRQGFVGRRVTIVMPAALESAAPVQLPARGSGAPLDEIAAAQLAESARCDAGELCTTWWPRGEPGADGTIPAMAVGVRERDADALADALEAGGLEVAAIDARGVALARACAGCVEDRNAVTAVVSVGHSAALVVALHAGRPIFERVLPESGTRELVERIVKHARVEPDVAFYALTRSAPVEAAPAAPGADALQAVREAAAAHAEALAREVSVSLSYALSTVPGGASGVVLLAGDAAEYPLFAASLVAAAGPGARIVRPPDVCACPPVLAPSASHASLMLACGLAMNNPRAQMGEVRP